MSKSTILISAFQPFISRNILNTGVLDELLARGARIVVLVPEPNADFYRGTYCPRGVIVEGVDDRGFRGRTERLLQGMAELLLDTNTKRFHRMIERSEGGSLLWYVCARSVMATLGRSRFAKRAFRRLETHHQPRFFERYLQAHRPDVVFATNVFGDLDASLIKDARRLGVRAVGMVTSWDNPTSKQLLRVMPDVLLAHNRLLCGELEALHVAPGARAVGTPHYDYVRAYRARSRQDSFAGLDIPEDRAVVLVSPAGRKFVDTDWQILQILKEAASAGEFSRPVHFLVRVHPTNKVDFGTFVPDGHFSIEDPGVRFAGVREKDNELDLDGFNHLLDCLEHSAAVVNTLSSIVIDACVRGRPVTTVGFDGLEPSVAFERSVGLYLEEENMAKLLQTGGAPVARDRRELVALINSYLAEPAKDAEARASLVAQQCMALDGKAKDRIADALGLPVLG